MSNITIYCVIGVEYTMENVPGKIHLIGTFTDVNQALKVREKKFPNVTFIDIVESTLDKVNNFNEFDENNFMNI